MSKKCKPKYKNLNLIQSFSEQKYATVQLMNQVCSNDEYLRQKVEELNYLTPPSVRKRFNPILVDEKQSYGQSISTNNEVMFSTSTQEEIYVDFTDESFIDSELSTCKIESVLDDNGTIIKRAILPKKQVSTLFKDTKHLSADGKINSWWYVGYDKAKNYQLRPDWIKSWKDGEIPSVCRAQTFKCVNGGVLEAISLSLQNNGVKSSNWGSPLYVQIWGTKTKQYDKTVWDKKKRKSVKISGKETIHVPNGNIHKPLAETSFNPSKMSPGFVSIVFDQPCKLETGKYYTICVFSPLSHYEHCPRIGGWGRNCDKTKYSDGDAFLSINNGRTWYRYGRNDLKVDYKFGKYTPQDFAFQLNIRRYGEEYDGEENYLYLTPILTNPITHVSLSADDEGGTSASPNTFIVYEISTNGKVWTPISNQTIALETPSQLLLVRAKMWQTSPGNTQTPSIDNLRINLATQLPKEMYVRTHFYSPKTSPMLGANLWGRIYAPFKLDPDVDCTVEIIQNKLVTEHFDIITAEELDEYVWIDGVNPPSDDLEEKYIYLINNPSVVQRLKEHNVYVKPHVLEGTRYMFSFEEGLKFTNSPSYPLKQCMIQPRGEEYVQSYSEWFDYLFDYDNDILKFKTILNNQGNVNEDLDLLTNMPVGKLSVSYNPLFVDGLTIEEVGARINEDNGLNEEGLILDYFKEKIIISDEILETRRVPIRVAAVDPLKEIILNKDSDNEKILFEDIHFSMDYINNELIFEVNNTDTTSTLLKMGDELEIIYTPNLEDTGIAIAYHAHRKNTDNQCRIKSNYIEYKV